MSSRPIALEALAALLPPRARLIGVDLGSKTIGLALSDVERRIATPLVTIEARGNSAEDARRWRAKVARIRSLCAGVRPAARASTASDGPRAQATRAFVRNFSALIADAAGVLGRAHVDRRRHPRSDRQRVSRARRAEVIDKMAAAYILQGALDRLAASPGGARVRTAFVLNAPDS